MSEEMKTHEVAGILEAEMKRYEVPMSDGLKKVFAFLAAAAYKLDHAQMTFPNKCKGCAWIGFECESCQAFDMFKPEEDEDEEPNGDGESEE